MCRTDRSDYAGPVCQSTSAAEVERWVAEQVLLARQPAALEAGLSAAGAIEGQRQQRTRHWEQRIERAKYDADRAARQYHAREPENRLVARTLEHRWDQLLREVGRLEDEFDRFRRTQPRVLGDADREAIRQLAERVPAVWHAATTTAADRRQIVRRRIARVVLAVEPGGDRVEVRIAWAGGAVREQTIRRAVRGYRHLRDGPLLRARVAALHEQNQTPAEIAGARNQSGFRSPKRTATFTAGMVRRLLAELGLRPRMSRGTDAGAVLTAGAWWLHARARHLGVSPHTLPGWRKKGWLHARQVGGRGGPWAVWAGGTEMSRLRALKECPRVWANRDRLATLRVPASRA
ncbi:hypothetical protein FRUB_04730 [Fimbriiglobus ruber]|uniref:Uncharacterized protein n=1 Tax=Fimbriiglobus ruber TaxID=1908690 RepID=A0A225DQH1_9BACT|nr:hypothetical protein FRUB_04730 [Fimbriiglobus ruber]